MLFVCCCITFIKYPSLALMGCKLTLGEKYIKIKLQTAWENAFQVPHKDFIPISKASPRDRVTGFTLELADAGTGLCFLQYQDLHRLWAWVIGNARFAVRARQMVSVRREDKQNCYYQESGKSGLRGLSSVLIWLQGIMWFYSMTQSCFYSICVTQESWICIRPSVFQERIFCSVMWTH